MPKDPLDNMMRVLLITLMGAVLLTLYGYPQVWVVLVLFGAVSWWRAPRRSYPTAEAISKGIDLSGKIAFITGPTSGIGTETARVLALRGAHVILASRDASKLAATEADIETRCAKDGVRAKLSCVTLDLNDQASIRAGVVAFEKLGLGNIDYLINNAGVMALKERKETAQGLERQVGVNHVGHFLLTKLLLPHLKAGSRVIVLSSSAYRLRNKSFPYNAQLDTNPYHPWEAYGNSKIANVMFANEFNRRHSKADGITACSVMPGGIHTGLQGDVDWWTHFKWAVVTPFFFKSIEQGAATTIKCALVEDLSGPGGGAYFNNCAKTDVADKNTTPEACQKLWDLTEALIAE